MKPLKNDSPYSPAKRPSRTAKKRPYVKKAEDALSHFEGCIKKVERERAQQALDLGAAALWVAEAFAELVVRVKNGNISADDIPTEINFETIKRLNQSQSKMSNLKK